MSTKSIPTEYHKARALEGWHAVAESSSEQSLGEGPTRAGLFGADAQCTDWWLVNPANHDDALAAYDGRAMHQHLRDEWWDLIVDAERDNLMIPRRLTWTSTPRTREYLNAAEPHLDRDYFAPAYTNV